MVRFQLGIRYLSQLRRIRPNELGRLESSVVGALRDSGGRVGRDGGVLYADFDDRAVAFWLDLAIALETISSVIAAMDRDLLGRVCLVRSNPSPSPSAADLTRSLSLIENETAMWCDAAVAASLAEYADFKKSSDHFILVAYSFRKNHRIDGRCCQYRRSLAEDLIDFLDPTQTGIGPRALAAVGPEFSGKRYTVVSCLRENGREPALVIRFGRQAQSLASIAAVLDARREGTRHTDHEQRADPVAAVLSRRLCVELPAALVDAFENSFEDHLQLIAKSKTDQNPAILVLVDCHLADSTARRILKKALAPFLSEAAFRLIMTGTNETVFTDFVEGELRFSAVVPPRGPDWGDCVRQIRDGFGLAAADSALIATSEAAIERKGIGAGYRSAIGWIQNADGRPLLPHPRLSEDLLEIAYALSISSALFTFGELAETFYRIGKPKESLAVAMEKLTDLGLIDDADDPRLLCQEFDVFAVAALADRADVVRGLIRERLLDAVRKKTLHTSFELIQALVRLGGRADSDLLLDAVMNAVVHGEFAAIEDALSDGTFEGTVGYEEAKRVKRFYRVGAARARGVTDSNITGAGISMLGSDGSSRYSAHEYLDRAAAALSNWPLDEKSAAKAAASAKSALLLLQDFPKKRGLARAYRFLGETELAFDRVKEAVDYFSFARESADASDDPFEAFMAEANGATVQMLLGNLAKAERHATEAEKIAADSFSFEWTTWAGFLRARILFELGSYAEAARRFENLEPAVAMIVSEKMNIARFWRFRSLSFAEPRPNVTIPSEALRGDLLFFALESAFIRGDMEGALEFANDALAETEKPRLQSPDRADWNSGFSFVEDRVFGRRSGDRVIRRLVRSYRSLALAASGQEVAAVEEANRLLKEENLSPNDPYDAFYLWTLFSVLTSSGATAVDSGTVLSRAFKRLQARASRIDIAELRRAYVSKNHWNAALLADARAANLI